jgi:predicted GNAT family acetyltransferase
MDDAIEITHDSGGSRGRYTLLLDGAPIGELDHVDHDGVRTYTHTGIRPEHEGKGLAGRLVRRAFHDARLEGVQVVGACTYVAAYLDRHPEDDDLRP